MQKSVIQAFIRGLDGKTPPGLRAIGALDVCENFVIEKGGELGLQLRKRYGTQSISATTDTGASLTTARRLKAFGSELIQLTDDRLYSRSVGGAKWFDRGSCPSFTLTTTPDIDNTATQTCPDAAYFGGIRVLAWEDSRGGVRYSVIDQTTGQAIVNDAVLDAAGTLPRVSACGTSVLLFYVSGSVLQVRRIALTSPQTISAPVGVVSVGGSPSWYDVLQTATDRVVFAARTAAGTYQVGYVSSAPAAVTAPAPANISATVDLAAWARASDTSAYAYLLTYTSGGALAFVKFDLTGLANIAPVTLDASPGTTRNVCGYASGSTITALYENSAGASYNALTKRAVWNGASATLSTFKRSVGLASHPFMLGARTCVALTYDSTAQPTYFVADIATGDIVARFHPEIGGGLTAKSILPGTSAPSSTSVMLAALRRTQLAVSTTGTVLTPTGVNTVTLTTADHALGSPVEFNGGAVIPSACPRWYDGAQTVEAGFHLFPETPAAPTQATGGSLTLTGVYQYMFGWEWVDRNGQRHRSTLSPVVTVTMTGSNTQNTFTVPTDRLTSKSPVSLVVWRTKAGAQSFFRCSSMTTPTLNDPTVDSITWLDQLSDTNLGNGEPLFSTLDPLPPPASKVAATWKNRAWVAGAEDGNYLYPSLELQPGYGPAWSDALKVRIEAEGGPITALVGFDDFLIAFKNASAYYVTGDGPDANGNGQFWALPLRLPSAVGTIDPDSVVRVRDGVMFKSPKGWYLITRSLDVQYKAAADDFAGLTVTGSMVDDSSDLVRFTTSSGTTVCWDQTFDRFLAHTNQAAVAAAKWQGVFCYLDAAGVVHQEVAGSYGDDGAHVRARAVFSFASIAGWLGRGRVFRVHVKGEYRGTHGLLVKTVYDGGAYAPEAFPIDVDATLGVTTYGQATPYGSESPYGGWDGNYEFEVRPARQRLTSLQVSVETYSPSGAATAGLSLTGLAFEVGADVGLNRLASSRRAAGS